MIWIYKIKKKKKKRLDERKREANKSKLANKNKCLTYSIILFFLCLFFFFFLRWKRYFFFDTMDNNITYSRSYRWVSYELSFNKIETKATLETSLGMF